jgi:phosphomannomutase
LSAIRSDWPVVLNTPEVRFPIDEARKFAIMEEIRRRVRDGGADVTDIDGVRVRTADGWWLLRASNTQAILVARCEGRDAAGLERLKQSVNRALQEAGQSPPAW